MDQRSGSWKLGVQGILLAILLLGMTPLIITQTALVFVVEILVLAVLLLLSLMGLSSFAKPWGKNVLFVASLIYIINLIFLWLLSGSLFITLLIIAVVNLFLAFPPQRKHQSVPSHSTSQSRVYERPVTVAETLTAPSTPTSTIIEGKAKEPMVKTQAETAKTSYSPGKYVASKSSNVYHEPRCDWAKKIMKDRRIWFAGRKEAQQKGYRKHECVR